MSSGDDAASVMTEANAAVLERELDWLSEVLHARLTQRFGAAEGGLAPLATPPPPLDVEGSAFGRLVNELRIGTVERLVLLLALAPHLRPQLLDPLLVRDANTDRGFTEFGGSKGRAHGGFLPTGETAAFLVAGDGLAARLALGRLFEADHVFRRYDLLHLDHEATNEPFLSGALVLTDEGLARLTSGARLKPDFSASFPARPLTTALDWEDLVLGPDVRAEIEILKGWIAHGDEILEAWGLGRVLKPGYRSLFHGPPGTGKTLTAALIGKACGRDVYRVDLSMVVSKYIGETEKNLSRVFDRAEHDDWILFFDEADALFGKRTATASSNDRYANQEVSYLLQRVEDFPGHVILATNLKANIDEAFARRFQSMIHFPMPTAEQRLRIWQGMLRTPSRLADDVSLEQLAERHELSGGAIANVVRFAAISAVRAGREAITAADLSQGVVKELRKEGRTP